VKLLSRANLEKVKINLLAADKALREGLIINAHELLQEAIGMLFEYTDSEEGQL
jgi:hypothetical protein